MVWLRFEPMVSHWAGRRLSNNWPNQPAVKKGDEHHSMYRQPAPSRLQVCVSESVVARWDENLLEKCSIRRVTFCIYNTEFWFMPNIINQPKMINMMIPDGWHTFIRVWMLKFRWPLCLCLWQRKLKKSNKIMLWLVAHTRVSITLPW